MVVAYALRIFAAVSLARRRLDHVLFRDRDRNPDILDPADGRLEQDAENEESCAIPCPLHLSLEQARSG